MVHCRPWFIDGTFETMPSLSGQLHAVHVLKRVRRYQGYSLRCQTKRRELTNFQKRPELNIISLKRQQVKTFHMFFIVCRHLDALSISVNLFGYESSLLVCDSVTLKTPNFSLQLWSLLAPAFVPVAEAETALNIVASTFPTESGKSLNYFEDVYIGRPM